MMLSHRAALHKDKRSIRAAKAKQSGFEEKPCHLKPARTRKRKNRSHASDDECQRSWRPSQARPTYDHEEVQQTGEQQDQQEVNSRETHSYERPDQQPAKKPVANRGAAELYDSRSDDAEHGRL